jgi:hypothetical protein
MAGELACSVVGFTIHKKAGPLKEPGPVSILVAQTTSPPSPCASVRPSRFAQPNHSAA